MLLSSVTVYLYSKHLARKTQWESNENIKIWDKKINILNNVSFTSHWCNWAITLNLDNGNLYFNGKGNGKTYFSQTAEVHTF